MGFSDVAEVVLHVIIVAWEDQRLSTSLSFCLCLLSFLTVRARVADDRLQITSGVESLMVL